MAYSDIVSSQQELVKAGYTRNLDWRKSQLLAMLKMVTENEIKFISALQSDLAKPETEAWSTEVSYVTGDIKHTLKNLKKWTRARKVPTALVAQPGMSYVQPEPKGSVLIMSAWNYPLQLALAPLVAVIAAGNTAVIKPSELAPATSKLLAELVPQYLDTKAFTVIEGAVAETTELLKQPFDHIMYTGNGTVAKIVMRAAAEHLTPVTLELCGKSPVYVDASANLNITCQRLAWGKWLNAGQTCIAPDYVLIEKGQSQALIEGLKQQINAMYGENVKASNSYGRIINERHCQRVASYLEGMDIVAGGEVDINTKFIAPTIVLNPDLTSPLMQDEIFGPVLPIIEVDNFEQAKQFVLEREKPLAAYIFSKSNSQQKEWVEEISAGNQCINDVIMFSAVPELPFGGVGPSGMGQYCGKAGIDEFSHLKAVLKRPFLKDLAVRFAPYSNKKLKLLKLLR